MMLKMMMKCLEKEEEGHRCTNIEDERRRYRSKTNERFSKRRRARGFESTVACRKLEISLPVVNHRRRRGRGDIEGGFGSEGRTRRKRRGDEKKK